MPPWPSSLQRLLAGPRPQSQADPLLVIHLPEALLLSAGFPKFASAAGVCRMSPGTHRRPHCGPLFLLQVASYSGHHLGAFCLFGQMKLVSGTGARRGLGLGLLRAVLL